MEESVNKSFNHFKIHSQFSICEGAVRIDELKEFCKKNKIRSAGISDTSNLSGALEFSESLSKVGTQPIIGTQIYFETEFNDIGLIPLIAKNNQGYQRIIELSSMSYLKNTKTELPKCNFKDLLSNGEGIIVLSGGINGFFGNLFNKGKLNEVENYYSELSKNYKNNFYIEIQRHNDKNEIFFENFNLKISKKLNIPLIASHEIYYLDKSTYEAHDALICIGTKSYLNDKNRFKLSNQHYYKLNDEMKKLFNDLPEALENNYNLPFRCNFRPTYSKPILPKITTKTGENPNDILKKEAEDGLLEKFKIILKKNFDEYKNDLKYLEYKKRLDHEIKIISHMNYASYFLIVSDYIKWSKKNDIPVGPGRGSGAGSLAAWCLSITDVDPIKFNLIFERFLNPDRISMPDFDIDFCEEKRDLVFQYLSDKYKNSVAHIITFGKLKARMVIRDVGRVIGLPYGFVDSICKMIPFDPSRPMSLKECINSEPRLQNLINEDKRVAKLVDLSLQLEGLNRNIATHAAGVVIGDKNLTNRVPLYKDSTSNLLLPSTQFDMYSSENAGLVKFDFLGLKTLTVINKTQNLINEANSNFKIDEINYEDPKVFQLLSKGKTVGLFQLESTGMREALTQMKPNRLEDIIALVALYRPGPMSNIPIYNDCKNGKREPDYLHPKLKEILKPTYGVIIYQEQVMQIAQLLSGFTAGEADILRRAMGKKKRAELEQQKQRFISGAEKNGIPREVAASIFLKIEPFAEYGFNKSHAAAYAIIAYQTAYLKTHYPNEFFAASMSMELSNQKKLSEFYEELKKMKINILRPDINECFEHFKTKDNNFYYALGALKNVGYEAISNIVKERKKNGKFKSLNNFIERVNPKDINKLQMEGLVKSGAFDKINSNRKLLFDSIPNIILKNKRLYENKEANQTNLFSKEENTDEEYLKKVSDWLFEDRLSKEFETVGFFISDHPLNQFKDIFKEYGIINYDNFVNQEQIKSANVAATVLKVQEKKTQKGTSYSIIKFSDLSMVFELFIFSDVFELNREILKEGNSMMLMLMKNDQSPDNESKSIRVNVKKISLLKNFINQPIESVKFDLKNQSDIKVLQESLIEHGKTSVNIEYYHDNNIYSFELLNKRKIGRKLLNDLKIKQISSKIN